MAMSVGSKRSGAIAEINVTPMADVMIVLLIIFMVMTPLIARSPVPLPGALHSAEKQGDTLRIVVTATGEISAGDAFFGDAETLAEYVRQRVAVAGKSSSVLVQADRRVPYTAVARVLEACRRAGVEEIALAAEKKVGS